MTAGRLTSNSTRRGTRAAIAALGLIAGLALAAPGGASADTGQIAAKKKRGSPEWTKRIETNLSARKLDLRGNASGKALAQRAISRLAPRLGLGRSTKGLRLARSFSLPSIEGSQPVTTFTFNQTAGGLRLIWSEIDVTVAGDTVSEISSTVVPATRKLAGRRKVSKDRALAIAKRAVAGEEVAVDPEAIAYAGNPKVGRARPRTPRRAWVVRVDAPSAAGEDSATGICVVIDAQTGKVLAQWEGTAARDLTPPPGADGGPEASASAATSALKMHTSTSASTNEFYALFTVPSDPRTGPWPDVDDGLYVGTRTQLRDTLTFNTLNVIRTICVVRNYCGKRGVYNGAMVPWDVVMNSHDLNSKAFPSALRISIGTDDASSFNGANDLIAHEVGHIQDSVLAGDRQVGSFHTQEVQEGLADMFAFDYDRFDTIFMEDMIPGGVRRWDNPTGFSEGGLFYPAVRAQYHCNSGRPPHLNSTIISHAFFKFSVSPLVGMNRAGAVLQHVPSSLPPLPAFSDVRQAFIDRAGQLYRGDDPADADKIPEVREAAISAFSGVNQTPFPCVPPRQKN